MKKLVSSFVPANYSPFRIVFRMVIGSIHNVLSTNIKKYNKIACDGTDAQSLTRDSIPTKRQSDNV